MGNNIKYPVVLFAFKRAFKTGIVLTEILRSKPTKLYIFIDGPRNADERIEVSKTRSVVDKLLSKKGNTIVVKRYYAHNLGLKRSIVTGLDTVFETEAAAIVLEDDCLPSKYFFDFCNTALWKFKDNRNINTICATNISSRTQNGKCITSRYFIPWGWALWKRSWQNYKSVNYSEVKTILHKSHFNKILGWYLFEVYKLALQGVISAWSYNMIIMQIVREKFSLIPPVNLVSNMGFGSASSNTFFKTGVFDLQITPGSGRLSAKHYLYTYGRRYDTEIEHRVFLTPVSILGLIGRKYFLPLVRYIYRK